MAEKKKKKRNLKKDDKHIEKNVEKHTQQRAGPKVPTNAKKKDIDDLLGPPPPIQKLGTKHLQQT